MDSYTEAIRSAHIRALKQKYLDAIDKAQADAAAKQADTADEAAAAYRDAATARRDAPQRLRALGLDRGGEAGDALYAIAERYRGRLAALEKERRGYLADYERAVETQTRLMNEALDEYAARSAKEDAAAAAKTAKSTRTTRSSGSKTTSSGSGKTSGSGKAAAGETAVANVPQYQGSVVLQADLPRLRDLKSEAPDKLYIKTGGKW